MIDYLKDMIAPPLEEAVILEGTASDLNLSKLPDCYAHGLILKGEPTEEESAEIFRVLKPGAHVFIIPEGSEIGHKGVISLEDAGFEVRDALFVAEDPDSFYYTSKASRREREAGLKEAEKGKRSNPHPTVKPIDIMEWCGRDVEKGSLVVDPFMGSGTTGIAMAKLGHSFIGIELQEEYAEVSLKRIQHWSPNSEVVLNGEPAKKDLAVLGDLFSLFSD